MSKDSASKRSDVIAEEAAVWFIALQYPAPDTKLRFLQWLKISPEHVSEFLGVAALWDTLPEVSALSLEELVALAAGDDNVIELAEPGSSTRRAPVDAPHVDPGIRSAGSRTRRVWIAFAAAATLAGLVIGASLPLTLWHTDPNLHSTAIGKQASLTLPDGSMVNLNTQSTIRVNYSDAQRIVELLSGEALFEVFKDPSRPFRVITDYAVIEAVGTQFNVRSAAEDVIVTVVEGIVDVSATARRNPAGEAARSAGDSEPSPVVVEPLRLTVGQQARVQSSSGEVAVVETTISTAIAWQQRRLVFESLPLRAVIDEFNSYNDPPLEIDDRELEQLPISGVFRSNDRESFVQFLSQMQLAESYTRADGTIVLRSVQGDR